MIFQLLSWQLQNIVFLCILQASSLSTVLSILYSSNVGEIAKAQLQHNIASCLDPHPLTSSRWIRTPKWWQATQKLQQTCYYYFYNCHFGKMGKNNFNCCCVEKNKIGLSLEHYGSKKTTIISTKIVRIWILISEA